MLALRALARAPTTSRCLSSSRPLLRTTAPRISPGPNALRRPFTHNRPRRARFPDPDAEERLRRARPLFHRDTPRRVVRSPTTKKVAIFCMASAALFYWWNLQTVPVSGRVRFNIFSDEFIANLTHSMVQEIEKEVERSGSRFLPEWDPRTRLVKKVMARLIPVSGGGELVESHTPSARRKAPSAWSSLAETWGGDDDRLSPDGNGTGKSPVQWEVRVIDDPALNAFVLPGGKVFVHRGILNVTRSEAGLAAVLGHEIAHNMASHAGERLSNSIGPNILMGAAGALAFIFPPAVFLFAAMGGQVQELLLEMPMSRKQESEADHIGLMLMAEACYDPREAVRFWQRMSRASDEMGQEVPELLSTHPSNRSRIEKLEALMPQALEKWHTSECAEPNMFVDSFRQAFNRA